MAVVLQFYAEVTGKSIFLRCKINLCAYGVKLRQKTVNFMSERFITLRTPEYLESEFLDHIS